jgi:5-methylcytosine-specific restriction protein A
MVKRIRGGRLQRIRARLLRGQPLCAHCLEAGLVRGATQVDHRVPLFQGGTEDDANKQSLCEECHKAKTITERGDTLRLGCDVNGIPADPTHHWRASEPSGSPQRASRVSPGRGPAIPGTRAAETACAPQLSYPAFEE